MSKVLVVDDNKQLCEGLKKHLEKKNYEVCTAQTVDEAKKKVLCEKFDYAIIDLKLEEVSWEFSGVKVVNFVKRNQPKVKTILLSGYAFEDAEEQLKKELKEEIDPGKILKEIEEDYIYKGGEQKYIDAVLDKLTQLEQVKGIKNCFVIMPFSETDSCTKKQWTEIFKNVIKPAVEDSGHNYRCKRANLHFGSIIKHILDNLNRSELVIADITDRNPNVLYELGVRHTLGGPTIVIAQNEKDVPFDLKPVIVKIYGWKTEDERNDFKEDIRETITYLEEHTQEAESPIREYLDPIGEKS